MFTGLVSAIGTIVRAEHGAVSRFTVESPYDPAGVEIGASICHDGCCLTVVAIEARGDGAGMRHTVEAVPETLRRTKLGQWREGTRVNLERSLRAGDELGGHFVTGHVDGLGVLVERTLEAGDFPAWRMVFEAPASLAPLLAQKGSIAIDGVSLTLGDVADRRFAVYIIPHTAEHTTLGDLQPGDAVNLEADILARYVARQLAAGGGARPGPASGKD